LFNSLEAAAHELDIVRSTEESKSAPENSEGGRGKESSEEQVARLGEAEWFKQEAEEKHLLAQKLLEIAT
jgi:hypothetical protein